jgi:aquaporin Z
MDQQIRESFPWTQFLAELAGTAILLLIGLSLVIFMFGTGSPMTAFIPNIAVRQVITGFLFGGTGATIAISGIGRESGAHLNPVVTMTFWLYNKIDSRRAVFYGVAQLIGAVIGTLPLLFWGQMGQSIQFGVTIPGAGYTVRQALMGEVITTFTMVTLLIVFLGFRETRKYTPAIFPILYSIMNPLESQVSGLSTNPARSFGPAVISGTWDSWWIYVIGPFTGAILACIVCSRLAKRITVAKLYHFDSDKDKIARKKLPVS